MYANLQIGANSNTVACPLRWQWVEDAGPSPA